MCCDLVGIARRGLTRSHFDVRPAPRGQAVGRSNPMASAGNKVLYPNERLNGGAFVKRRRMRVVGHWDCLRDYLVRVDATGQYLAAHRPSAAAGLTKDSKRAAVFNHQIRY